MELFLFFVALSTSVVGSICGIGGGVIIKPVLDATGVMGVSAISFLSGCTVLTMAVVSVGRSIVGGRTKIDPKTTPLLGMGAAAGGIVGKWGFDLIKTASGNESLVGFLQATILGIVTVLTFAFMAANRRGRIRTLRLRNPLVCTVIGCVLGLSSSFLGIGGGPINLAVLTFCFSMDAKAAATNSLCVILFSQIAALGQTFLSGACPTFAPMYLIAMCAGGILGGFLGQTINRRLSNRQVSTLFSGLMLLVIAICVYNAMRFAMTL